MRVDPFCWRGADGVCCYVLPPLLLGRRVCATIAAGHIVTIAATVTTVPLILLFTIVNGSASVTAYR
jgi:hypothetical protein